MLLMVDNLLGAISPHICKGCGAIGLSFCRCCISDVIKRNHPICLYCGAACSDNNLCKSCCKKHKCFDDLLAVAERSGALKRLVGDYKYNSEIECCRPLADILSNRLQNVSMPSTAVIIPVPTIPSHVRSRGFDHTLYLARQLSRRINRPVDNKILIRTDNMAQHMQNASNRRKLIQKSLAISPRLTTGGLFPAPAIPDYAILLDDIWTTGSTMETAAKLLKSVGVKSVLGLVVLYQPKRVN